MNFEKQEGKELMEKFHKGFKNKNYKKFQINLLLIDVENAYRKIYELKRQAGFFDKRGNIFSKEDKEKIKQIVGDVV